MRPEGSCTFRRALSSLNGGTGGRGSGLLIRLHSALVADELERRAVQSGDRELVALREVDLDRLDAVFLERLDDGGRAGVHDHLARGERDAVEGEIPVLLDRYLDDRVVAADELADEAVVDEVRGEQHLSVVDGEHDHVHVGCADVAVPGRVVPAGAVADDQLDPEVREHELELSQPLLVRDDGLVEDEGLRVEPASGSGLADAFAVDRQVDGTCSAASTFCQITSRPFCQEPSP